jgi:hypothetical protein
MATSVKRAKAVGKPRTKALARPPDKPSAKPPRAPDSIVVSLAKQLQSWTGSVLGNVDTASDVVMALAKGRMKRPGPKAAVAKAAAMLRDLRQAAGLTIEDLGHMLELEDPSFMDLVENGVVGLPFDLILRLAGVIGRHDPVGFILQMTRSYNPKMWKALEALGVGKLLVQAGREREFANIYRRHDAARELSDADFAAALSFADAAFATALQFHGKHVKRAAKEPHTDT